MQTKTLNKLFSTLMVTGLLMAGANSALAADIPVKLFKDPYCGCCNAYADYLDRNGFKVERIDSNKMDQIKKQAGTTDAASCHTSVIDGYVVEGHVPVAAINKLLTERPDIRGIALPGMPHTSPGMGPRKAGSLNVIEVTKHGKAGKLFVNL